MYSDSALNRALDEMWVGYNLLQWLPFQKFSFGDDIGHHSVAFDARMTAGNGSGGFSQQGDVVSSISQTVTLGASATLLVGFIIASDSNISDAAMTWNSGSMGAAKVSQASGSTIIKIFTLVNPTTGAHTLSCSWTVGSCVCYLSGLSFNGTDTSTGIDAAHSTSATGVHALSVTGTSDGATVTLIMTSSTGNALTTDQTLTFNNTALAGSTAAGYALGGTTTHTYSAAAYGTYQSIGGIHVLSGTAPVAVLEQTHYRFRADDGPLNAP